jgi:hypothetical protein
MKRLVSRYILPVSIGRTYLSSETTAGHAP